MAGVIGLGQMGRGIARNLDKAGLLASAWDLSEAARNALGASARAQVVPPAALGAACDTVLFAVPGSAEIDTCLAGPTGLLAADRPGQVLVDLTTSHPVATKRLAEIAHTHGRAYVDAGMSGGAQGADEGRLTLMVGADDDTLARVKPVLDAIAARVFHVGPVGAGHAMKLIHNMICHTIFLATAEGCRLAERAGLDLPTVVDVLNAGNARSFVSESRFPRHVLSGTWDGRSTVANLEKDLRMAADFAREIGTPGAYGPLTAGILTDAVNAGLAERDFTTLYRELDRLIGPLEASEGGAPPGLYLSGHETPDDGSSR
jgi:3-hydroxyisobutyrate dehydrogenase